VKSTVWDSVEESNLEIIDVIQESKIEEPHSPTHYHIDEQEESILLEPSVDLASEMESLNIAEETITMVINKVNEEIKESCYMEHVKEKSRQFRKELKLQIKESNN
jgi:hypothetical protein